MIRFSLEWLALRSAKQWMNFYTHAGTCKKKQGSQANIMWRFATVQQYSTKLLATNVYIKQIIFVNIT